MQSKLILLVTATILAASSGFTIPPNLPDGGYTVHRDASGKEIWVPVPPNQPNGLLYPAHHDASEKEIPGATSGFTVPPNLPNGFYSGHRDASGKETWVLIELADTTSTDTTIT